MRCGRALALCVALGGVPASADDDNRIKTVFVIAMENHPQADVFSRVANGERRDRDRGAISALLFRPSGERMALRNDHSHLV